MFVVVYVCVCLCVYVLSEPVYLCLNVCYLVCCVFVWVYVCWCLSACDSEDCSVILCTEGVARGAWEGALPQGWVCLLSRTTGPASRSEAATQREDECVCLCVIVFEFLSMCMCVFVCLCVCVCGFYRFCVSVLAVWGLSPIDQSLQ